MSNTTSVHFLLSTASLSILGHEHNLAEESAIVLWNAVSNEICDEVPSPALNLENQRTI